jgi:hypothetical protein
MVQIITLFLVIASFSVLAEEKKTIPICSLYYASAVKKVVEANGHFDKFKHCSVSCMLTLRCPASDVLEIGILKELADVVGPGNAEMADLRADYKGVDLAASGKAKTDKTCMEQCHMIYPENSCH